MSTGQTNIAGGKTLVGTAQPSDVRMGMTYPDGKELRSGTLDLRNLKPENVRMGVNINGIVGRFIPKIKKDMILLTADLRIFKSTDDYQTFCYLPKGIILSVKPKYSDHIFCVQTVSSWSKDTGDGLGYKLIGRTNFNIWIKNHHVQKKLITLPPPRDVYIYLIDHDYVSQAKIWSELYITEITFGHDTSIYYRERAVLYDTTTNSIISENLGTIDSFIRYDSKIIQDYRLYTQPFSLGIDIEMQINDPEKAERRVVLLPASPTNLEVTYIPE